MFEKRKFNSKRFHPAKILLFIVLAALFVFVMGHVIMYLWNAILPDVINAKPISFWQAVGIFVLARLLSGGFKGGRSHNSKRNYWRNKWANMNEEERHEFRSKWKNYCDSKKDT